MDDPDETYSSARVIPQYLDVQRRNPTTRVWAGLTFQTDPESIGHDRLPRAGISPRETITFPLRLPWLNAALPLKESSDGSISVQIRRPEADGRCKPTVGTDSFRASSSPAQPPGDGTASPSGNTATGPQTGGTGTASAAGSSALPWPALGAGTTVAIGGGTVYAVQRRRGLPRQHRPARLTVADASPRHHQPRAPDPAPAPAPYRTVDAPGIRGRRTSNRP